MPLLCPKDEIMKYKANFYYGIDDYLLLGVPLLRTTGVAGIRSTKQNRRIQSFLEKSLIKEEEAPSGQLNQVLINLVYLLQPTLAQTSPCFLLGRNDSETCILN